MKKLTWALLSLMLFLGMGTAFAQDLPKPTFTPAQEKFDIPSVTPGQEIVFTLDATIDPDDYMMGGIFILYNFYEYGEEPDDEPEYTTSTSDLNAWMGYLNEGGNKPATDYEVGMISSTGTDFKVTVPADASGYYYFYARLAGINEDMDMEYSAVLSSMYNVEGEAPVVTKPDMPTFSPATGTQVDPGTTVTIAATGDYDIIWYTTTDDGEPTENKYNKTWFEYTKPITINGATTLRAASVKGEHPPFTFSDVATAAYTVTDKERTDVPKLTVTPAGPIEIDHSATFSCALDPQQYTHASDKVGFGIKLKNGAGVEKLEYQVGEIDPDAWTAYRDQDLAELKRGTVLGAIPDEKTNNATNGRMIAIEAKTVHYRLTLPAGAADPEVVF
ncbi:MAG: chitobiase/beta-hexosaminidase C-terminal domain-containing protein, partial [Bacteroidales bacterium]|nr:chitobiase/beta-hexosaminidase C-terminal domain-containing protein [Bacteroidales bacterium]